MRDAIYCNGSLLAAVQNARLYKDCKEFVDKPLKQDADIVLAEWSKLQQTIGPNGTLPREVLAAFVDEHFEQTGGELEVCLPVDYKEVEFESISDATYRNWAKSLHALWPALTRRVADKVRNTPERYSLLDVPEPFVVPGGRFREQYYWDTYFAIKGMLVSGLNQTVRGMIINMGHLIDRYGLIPNGNRIYYLTRSQPPLMTWCLQAYYEATNDIEFVRRAMPWLEREMEFFKKNKLITQDGWKSYLFRFHVVATSPRPESYREDLESAEHLTDEAKRHELYGEIAAAAESGRDFSARWFATDGDKAGTMSSTRTSRIVPVELNSIICLNMRYMAEFYNLLGDEASAQKYRVQYEVMREAIHQVFWNEAEGSWFDYDLEKQAHTLVFHDTNMFPLYAGVYHDGFDSARIVSYMTSSGILNHPGGIPTSLLRSMQQWDFPSGWAPTNFIIIQGLHKSGQTEIARQLADRWLRRNYTIYVKSGNQMFEKYDVSTDCLKAHGGGGEYEVQTGFGWTNGVALSLLSTFSELVFPETAMTPQCECCRRRASVFASPSAAADVAAVAATAAAAAAAAAAAIVSQQQQDAHGATPPLSVPEIVNLAAAVAAVAVPLADLPSTSSSDMHSVAAL